MKCIQNIDRALTIRLTAVLLFFIALFSLCRIILPGAVLLELDLQFDHPDRIQFFYTNGLSHVQFTEGMSVFSGPVAADRRQTVRLRLANMPVKRVRLDTGQEPGVLKIYKMVVHSYFAPDTVLLPEDMVRIFNQPSQGVTVQLVNDFLEVTAEGDDPWIIASRPLLQSGFFLQYALPLFASLLFYAILRQLDFRRFPAFADINDRRPSAGENIGALDGLRGIAVIMVVADHTWGRFTGIGAEGVWIFMALSGFLLARPFVLQPERVLSSAYMGRFFLRRAQRILPVYYFYIIIIYVMSFRFDEAFRHFLFLQGSGHLWVVPQEVLFYLLTPLIMAINYLLFRGRSWLVIVNLIVLMALANRYLDADVLTLYGMNYQKLRPYLGIFIAGFLASYFYYGVVRQHEELLQAPKIGMFFSLLAWLLLLFFFLGSTSRLWGGHLVYAQIYFQWFGLGAAVLIFSILVSRQGMLNRFLCWYPLRALSVVSFSLYLFHPLVLNCIHKGAEYYWQMNVSGFSLLLATLVLSYMVACCSYTYIERPFMRPATVD